MEPWHLPIQISHLLDLRKISARELSRRCEISPSTLTQINSGQRCTPEVMTLLCQKLAETPAEAYGLVCAHLRDEVVRFKMEPSHVLIRHVEGADLKELDLTPEQNAYIGTVARGMEHDNNVAKVIEAISGMLVQRAALEADLAAKITPFPGTVEPLAAEDPAPYQATPTAQILSADAARRAQADRDRKSAASSSSKKSNA